MSRIFVGMSGGVDSTVAASILKDEGHEVVGLTLKLWDDASRCCNYDDIMDAKRACFKLGIRHYVLNLKKEFKKKVVDPFISGYINGLTPNPCVVCNDTIKFAALIKKMKELKFDYIATGHYARIVKKNGALLIGAGRDKKKSQEYFLARLDKKWLPRVKFPLGNRTKEEVKALAIKKSIYVEKRESQEICFLRDKETPYEFIARSADISSMEKGSLYYSGGDKIRDIEDGAYFKYTVGQRKGLGVSAGKPVYVVAIDAEKKRVILGDRSEAASKEIKLEDVKMFIPVKAASFTAYVRIRYMQKRWPAKIRLEGKKGIAVFGTAQEAVTPGQLAVFYRGNAVIGSGFISL